MSEYVYCSDGTPLASAGGEISLPRERVVRCGDCKFYVHHQGCVPYCHKHETHNAEDTGYCAWGERREQ